MNTKPSSAVSVPISELDRQKLDGLKIGGRGSRLQLRHLKKTLLTIDHIGVDEVGRGCLAGRVYAAAVLWPLGLRLRGVTDSKLLSEKRRTELVPLIENACRVSVAFADVAEIERLNILWASMLAMKRAIENLPLGPGVDGGNVLIDGNQKIPHLRRFGQTTVVDGDRHIAAIGAASIVAKVARDQYMVEMASRFPEYGFEKHKGYASEQHRLAIQKHGPCCLHRKTFAGVREFCGEPNGGSVGGPQAQLEFAGVAQSLSQ